MGFLKLIVQVFFLWCFELTWVGGERWGPEGWGFEGWGAQPRKSGAPKGGGPKGGGPKFRAFFSLSRRKIRSFLRLYAT